MRAYSRGRYLVRGQGVFQELKEERFLVARQIAAERDKPNTEREHGQQEHDCCREGCLAKIGDSLPSPPDEYYDSDYQKKTEPNAQESQHEEPEPGSAADARHAAIFGKLSHENCL